MILGGAIRGVRSARNIVSPFSIVFVPGLPITDPMVIGRVDSVLLLNIVLHGRNDLLGLHASFLRDYTVGSSSLMSLLASGSIVPLRSATIRTVQGQHLIEEIGRQNVGFLGLHANRVLVRVSD